MPLRESGLRPAAFIFCVALLVAGCQSRPGDGAAGNSAPREGEAPEAVSAVIELPAVISFARDIQPIFDRSCLSCHRSREAPLLATGVAYGQLVGVEALCGPLKRVEPGDKARSALWLKLAGDPACGDPMPMGINSGLKGNNLREFLTVERWIEQGAPDN